MQPTGYCQFSKCRKPLYNGLKYCNTFCGNSARTLRWRAKPPQQAACIPQCTHEIPPYGVCVRCENAKRRAEYKRNKKHVWGAKLAIPHASFPKG